MKVKIKGSDIVEVLSIITLLSSMLLMVGAMRRGDIAYTVGNGFTSLILVVLSLKPKGK